MASTSKWDPWGTENQTADKPLTSQPGDLLQLWHMASTQTLCTRGGYPRVTFPRSHASPAESPNLTFLPQYECDYSRVPSYSCPVDTPELHLSALNSPKPCQPSASNQGRSKLSIDKRSAKRPNSKIVLGVSLKVKHIPRKQQTQPKSASCTDEQMVSDTLQTHERAALNGKKIRKKCVSQHAHGSFPPLFDKARLNSSHRQTPHRQKRSKTQDTKSDTGCSIKCQTFQSLPRLHSTFWDYEPGELVVQAKKNPTETDPLVREGSRIASKTPEQTTRAHNSDRLYFSCFPLLVEKCDGTNRQRHKTLSRLLRGRCALVTPELDKADFDVIQQDVRRSELGDKVTISRSAMTQTGKQRNDHKSMYRKHRSCVAASKASGLLEEARDAGLVLHSVRRPFDIPVVSYQQYPKQQPPNFFPNVWQAILRSRDKKTPEMEQIDNNTTSEDDELAEPTEADTNASQSQNSAAKSASYSSVWPPSESRDEASQCSASSAGDHVSRNKRRGKKPAKLTANSTKNDGVGLFTVLKEVREILFAPYNPYSHQDVDDADLPEWRGFESSSQDADSKLNSVQCGCLPEPSATEADAKRHTVTSPKLISDEVKRECSVKGYEVLRGLWRGASYQHSNIFLACNRVKPEFSPVEIVAFEQPYSNLTSSLYAACGRATARHRINNRIPAIPAQKNLVMLLHRFCTTNAVYQVTEHFPWPSLSHLISTSTNGWVGAVRKGLTEETRRSIFRQICSGMSHLHLIGVIHGDLNCNNILVTDRLQVKLSGYGPACQRVLMTYDAGKGRLKLGAGAYDIYTPPELLSKAAAWTRSCDVWSMGIVLLEMTLGEIPPAVNAAVRLNGSIKKFERITLDNCGYQLSILIDKILQPRPSQRPSVWALSQHAWMSDGTEMAGEMKKHARKKGVRRTDGSTFPLPKRVQNQDPLSREAFYAYSESETPPPDDKASLNPGLSPPYSVTNEEPVPRDTSDEKGDGDFGIVLCGVKQYFNADDVYKYEKFAASTVTPGRSVEHVCTSQLSPARKAEALCLAARDSPCRAAVKNQVFIFRNSGKGSSIGFLSRLIEGLDCVSSGTTTNVNNRRTQGCSSPDVLYDVLPDRVHDLHAKAVARSKDKMTGRKTYTQGEQGTSFPQTLTDTAKCCYTEPSPKKLSCYGVALRRLDESSEHSGMDEFCESGGSCKRFSACLSDFVLEDDDTALEELEQLIKKEEQLFWRNEMLKKGAKCV